MEGLAFVKKQLFTDEDPAHIHKILGISCLLSTLWRFSMVGERDMGFGVYPVLTLPTLVLHLCLTTSAFLFHMPHTDASKQKGTVFWPEYRLHALVFLCRSLAVLALTRYEQADDLPPNYDWNLVIVMASSVWKFVEFSVLGTTSYCLYGLRRFSIICYSAALIPLTPFS